MSTLELPLDPPAPPPAAPADAPLAERLRPHTLAEVIGQQHLLGPGKPLRVAFESGRLHSMILWGPPGVGKTTLARILAQGVDAHLIVLSAVLAGVKDIREAVERAKQADHIVMVLGDNEQTSREAWADASARSAASSARSVAPARQAAQLSVW